MQLEKAELLKEQALQKRASLIVNMLMLGVATAVVFAFGPQAVMAAAYSAGWSMFSMVTMPLKLGLLVRCALPFPPRFFLSNASNDSLRNERALRARV